MTGIYSPTRALPVRVHRRLVPFRAKRSLAIKLDNPIVSLTFDDCPKSVIETAIPAIEDEGWQASLYVAMGLCGTTNHLGLHMSEGDVKAAYANGHEIGGHTLNHINVATVSSSNFKEEIEKNQTKLVELGIPASQTFAYPYGETNLAAKNYVTETFSGARGIRGHVHRSSVDLNQIGSKCLYSGQHFENLLREISTLRQNPGWMTIYTHDVRDNPSPFGCTPGEFLQVVSTIKSSGAQVMPVASAINFLQKRGDK